MASCKHTVSDKNHFDIPVWHRYTMTIEEAAGYYHIGEGKLRMLIDQNPHEDFYVMNGNRNIILSSSVDVKMDVSYTMYLFNWNISSPDAITVMIVEEH